jgi:hypothetical protein
MMKKIKIREIRMDITSKTKIYDLLQEFPVLEEQIMNMAPPFRNLKNPVLRRTVGKLATLEKAAQIGGIDVAHFVNTLRAAVGQPELKGEAVTVPTAVKNAPDWIQGQPVHVIDGVEMLNQGIHPLNKINELMQSLPGGKHVLLLTNFKPLPLIEAMEKQNYSVYHRSDEHDQTKHMTFIGKPAK